MRLTFLLTMTLGCCVFVQAQQKFFEGTLTYHVDIKSKVPFLSDKEAYKLFSVGEKTTATMKNGNERLSNELADNYYIYKDKKIYLKLRHIDTLYYLDYSWDTSQVLSLVKIDSSLTIAGYACKKMMIKTSAYTRRYYYSDALHSDTNYYRDVTVGHYNDYVHATNGSISLWTEAERSYGIEKDSCIKVVQESVDDHIFDLPNLPRKDLSTAKLYIPPRFPGKENAFKLYLEKNLDHDLAAKYVKIPKGEQEVNDTVKVLFYVEEDGSVSKIEALNKKEMPSALVKEAIRVVGDSPRWIPGSVYGEKIRQPIRQNVVFAVVASK